MKFTPKKALSEDEVRKGLRLVIVDGLMAEIMITLSGGAFLVAMALLIGASNFQIGVLAALPTFTNVFQLASIWLVQRYNNRRVVTVICSILARVPLLVIAALLFSFSVETSVNALILVLFFHYLFGSIAGPGWNAWIKDLVPQQMLGNYFARRTRYNQMLNVVLSITLALSVDYVKKHYPDHELMAYAFMFGLAGVAGIYGAIMLARVQEPESFVTRENLFKLFTRPLKDGNFRRLLTFNAAWVFSFNLAAPFFTVFLLTSLGLPLSYVIGLNIISQLASIVTIRTWGAFADKYSNKNIIAIGGPMFILCLIAWCFVGIYPYYVNLVLLFFIYVFTGISTAGINLSIMNIGLKLAPAGDAIVYLSARTMITAVFSSLAPILGGKLADFFADRSLVIDAEWTGPASGKVVHLLSLHEWNFLFLIGAVLGLISLEFLVRVNEVGEVDKELVRKILRKSIRSNMRDYFVIGTLMSWHGQFWELIRRKADVFGIFQKRNDGVTIQKSPDEQ